MRELSECDLEHVVAGKARDRAAQQPAFRPQQAPLVVPAPRTTERIVPAVAASVRAPAGTPALKAGQRCSGGTCAA